MMTLCRVAALCTAMLGSILSSASGQATAPLADTSPVVFGAEPHIIGPGVVSTAMAEFGATRTADRTLMLYAVTDHVFSRMTIVEVRRVHGRWQGPEVASFSGRWNDADPDLAPDGKSLVFMSNRPMPGDSEERARRDFNLWRVERTAAGWTAPQALPSTINTPAAETAPSVSASGALYFSRGGHVFRSPLVDGRYAAPEPLPFPASNGTVSPDERMLVFVWAGRHPGDADLYVACHTGAGWSAPRRLAEPVNSSSIEGDPVIWPGGHTLAFASERAAATPAAWPRARAARYADLKREAANNIYNGLRNVYRVTLPERLCR